MLGQGTHDDAVELGWDLWSEGAGRRDVGLAHAVEEDLYIFLEIEHLTCEHFVDNDARREDVRAVVDGITPGLLGGHVVVFPLDDSDFSLFGSQPGLRDAEVDDFDFSRIGNDDVLRAHIAVDDGEGVAFGVTLPMGVVQPSTDFLANVGTGVDGDFVVDLRGATHDSEDVSAFDELHRDEVGVVELAEIKDLSDVDVVELDADLRLFDEHGDEMLILGEFWVDHLQREELFEAAEPFRLGQDDFCHSTHCDLLDEAVWAEVPRKIHALLDALVVQMLGRTEVGVKSPVKEGSPQRLTLRCLSGGFFLLLCLLLLPRVADAQSESRAWAPLLESARAVTVGRWDIARARLEALNEDDRPAEVRAALGLVELAQGKNVAARRSLEGAVEGDEALGIGYFWLGLEALRGKATARALPFFNVAVSAMPDRAEVRLARALTRARGGDRSGAVSDIIAAAKLRPNLLEPVYHPDLRRAFLEITERGLSGHPQQEQVRDTLTLMLFEAGFFLEAASRASGRATPSALEVMGRLALRRGDDEAAIARLSRAVREAPRSASARFHLARAAYQSGALSKASTVLREAARLSPTDHRVQIAIGDIARERGDLDRAELAYGYALAQQVEPRALTGLARVHELNGELEVAARLYRKALSIAPAAIEPLERFARLLERKGEEAKTVSRLRKRLKAAQELEADFEKRVSVFEERSKAHAEDCELIATTPRKALSRLGVKQRGRGRVEVAFAKVAAHSALGEQREAEAEARRVLAGMPLQRWAGGIRPSIVFEGRIGETKLVRATVVEYVPLSGLR